MCKNYTLAEKCVEKNLAQKEVAVFELTHYQVGCKPLIQRKDL